MPALSPEIVDARPVSVMPVTPATDFVFRHDRDNDTPAAFAVIGEKDNKPVFSVVVPSAKPQGYSVEVRWNISQPVRKGDVMLARFAARAIEARQESGEAAVGFYFQRATAPFDKCIALNVSVAPDWSVFSIPFTATHDYSPGEAAVYLSFGSLVQTVEITGIDVLNFQDRARLDQLPVTRFTYAGREAGAAWREQALQRIEQIRTAPINIRVTDASGRPVPNAKVDARLVQREFRFGSEVDSEFIQEQSPDADRYRALVKELFDTVTIGNGLKWRPWQNAQRRANALAALDWLNEQGLRVRGHTLVWPGWKFTINALTNHPDRANQIAPMVEAHIREMTSLTRGKIICWDVVNEPVHETDYFEYVPREIMARWFQLVREVDPNAELVINEYGMLNGSGSTTMIARYLELIRFLQERGAKIDAIGVQGHVGAQPRAPTAVLSDLDLLAVEKLPIEITEFDVNTKDEELQGDYTRDFLIACYSHPAMRGFVMWGFYEPKHWKPLAAMYRKDWSEKPNLKAWRDLVLNQWTTRLDTETSDEGRVTARGHKGRYTLNVTSNGQTKSTEFTLKDGGADVEVKFE